MGYTKLFGTILDSTIWQEDLHVKIVWITLLAMADRDGTVEASVPGLARRANVNIEQAEHAIARLSSPDHYSRTKEHEGRRIAALEEGGGWRLLNFEKYRDKLDAEDQRQKAAARQQRRRDRIRGERTGHANVTPERDDVTPDGDHGRDGHAASRPVRHTDQINSDLGEPPSTVLDLGSPELPDPGALDRAQIEEPPAQSEAPEWLHLEIPEGWRPDTEAELERGAAAVGVDVDDELRKLHDRCRARGDTSSDWQASWRTWLQRAIDWARKSAPANDVERARRQRAAVHVEMERDLEAIRIADEAAARDRAAVEDIARKALDELRGGKA